MIDKKAVGPATAAAAAAGGFAIYDSVIKPIMKKLIGYAESGVAKGVPALSNIALTAGVVGGLAGGYGLAKAMSPTVLAATSDKELEREALDTEIDITQRQLAALELKKKRRKRNAELPQKYDRFV